MKMIKKYFISIIFLILGLLLGTFCNDVQKLSIVRNLPYIPYRWIKGGLNKADIPEFEINIDKEGLAEYNSIIDSLLNIDTDNPNIILLPKSIKYTKARLSYKNIEYKAKVKLIGGQMDHYNSERFSLRVKVKDDDFTYKIKKFNLYNPKTRGGAFSEIIGHEMCKKEQFISLKHDLVKVKINGDNKGVYYLEEAFSDELVTSNGYTGILYKFNDKGVASAYGQKEIKKSHDLFNEQYYLFRNGKIPPDSIISIKKMGKFFALMDLIDGTHALRKSNLRMFYNADNLKLEPIGREFNMNDYDNLIQKTHSNILSKDFSNTLLTSSTSIKNSFTKEYFTSLFKFLKPSYIDTIIGRIDPVLFKYKMILNSNEPYYVEDYFKIFRNNQLRIKRMISPDKIKCLTANNRLIIQIDNKKSIPYKIAKIGFKGSNFVSNKVFSNNQSLSFVFNLNSLEISEIKKAIKKNEIKFLELALQKNLSINIDNPFINWKNYNDL